MPHCVFISYFTHFVQKRSDQDLKKMKETQKGAKAK